MCMCTTIAAAAFYYVPISRGSPTVHGGEDPDVSHPYPYYAISSTDRHQGRTTASSRIFDGRLMNMDVLIAATRLVVMTHDGRNSCLASSGDKRRVSGSLHDRRKVKSDSTPVLTDSRRDGNLRRARKRYFVHGPWILIQVRELMSWCSGAHSCGRMTDDILHRSD